jgi:PTH1 family peptidyl-tRNA hydrolase
MADAPVDLLVVGLGNPGVAYVGTRHNAGADVVHLLADRHGGRLKLAKRERSMIDDVRIDDKRVLLAFPQTYMNDSGVAVSTLARRGSLELPEDAERIVVVHDELDLPLGTVRVKQGGGLAGHNGLRSINAHAHTDAFLRVRIGIGKPPGGKDQGADHVLRRPAGIARAMNRFNTRKAPADDA